MKKILLTATLLVSSTLLFSQTKFGIKAGVNFATMDLKEEDSNSSVTPSSQTSFHFGGFAEFQLSPVFHLQPGLSISGKGYKIDEPFNQGGISGTIKQNLNLMYLEVPINLLAKLNAGSGKFFIGGGPYLGYGLSGKVKTEITASGFGESESESEEEDVKFGNSDEDDLKPLDFGLNLLTGYELSNGLFLNAGYGLGLANISHDGDGTAKNKVVSISLGFKF